MAAGFSLKLGPAALVASLGMNIAARKALMAMALELQKSWKEVLSTPGTGEPIKVELRTIKGRVVPVGPRVPHRPSAAGQPPAPDTGALRASIGIDDSALGGPKPRVRVGSGLKYAAYLQFGVKSHPGGITIKPRPHADVALKRVKKKMGDIAVSTLRAQSKHTRKRR